MSYLSGRHPVFFKGKMYPFRELSEDRTLHGSHWRVLIHLIAEMDWSNQAVISQAVIASRLGLDRATVSRVVRDLETRGLIRRFWRWDGERIFEIGPVLAECGRDHSPYYESENGKTCRTN